VPVIFGMNFQAVSVGQKLIEKNVGNGGYQGPRGAPTSHLLGEIEFVDASIGKMVSELKKQGLFDSTLVVITAKHGQSPIDPNRFFPIAGPDGNNGRSPANIIASLLPFSESPNNPNGIGPTEDDISLLWLANSSDTADAVKMLQADATHAGIGVIFVGPTVAQMFNPPDEDPRTPDIVITPNPGVVYTGSSKKLSEHGGFSHDDTNVMLLLSNSSLSAKTITTAVGTAQVAPTILKALGLDPNALDAVRIEGTQVLPGLPIDFDHEQH
jgi:arylsulfatase A-like enzyme